MFNKKLILYQQLQQRQLQQRQLQQRQLQQRQLQQRKLQEIKNPICYLLDINYVSNPSSRGFSNQMFYIIKTILELYKLQQKYNSFKIILFIKNMQSDIFTQKKVSIHKFFDIVKTNKNLKEGFEILEFSEYNIKKHNRCIVINNNSHIFIKVFSIHESVISVFNSFVPNKTVLSIIDTIKPKCAYNTIHFRLDIDCILHYCYNNPSTKIRYPTTFNLDTFVSIKDAHTSIRYSQRYITEPVINWIENVYSKYVEAIKKNGVDKHYYICSPIIRDPRHKISEKYLHRLLEFLPNKTFIDSPFHPDREISAYIELEIIRKSKGLIGFNGSTLSKIGKHLTKKIYFVSPPRCYTT